MIRVQTDDFDLAAEYENLRRRSAEAGALVTFTGLVRDFDHGTPLHAMTLEHYPGMTEKSLARIVEQARQRCPVDQVTVIHRVGTLQPGEQIVFVGVSSAHREAAFSVAHFIMDFLKTEAPFWKKESTTKGEFWVDAKTTDDDAAKRWRQSGAE